jgi:methylase of polypeptide subunit release factors
VPPSLDITQWDSLARFVQDPSLRESLDVVVTNPPFVSVEDLPSSRRNLLLTVLGDAARGKTDLYLGFTGPAMLQRAAIKEVQTWKFSWDHPCACQVKREVVFVYTLGDWIDEEGPSSAVKWFGRGPVDRVEIRAGLISVQTSTSK